MGRWGGRLCLGVSWRDGRRERAGDSGEREGRRVGGRHWEREGGRGGRGEERKGGGGSGGRERVGRREGWGVRREWEGGREGGSGWEGAMEVAGGREGGGSNGKTIEIPFNTCTVSPHRVPFFLEDSPTDGACQEVGVASIVFSISIYSCIWKVWGDSVLKSTKSNVKYFKLYRLRWKI
jgi:hypothetical protein